MKCEIKKIIVNKYNVFAIVIWIVFCSLNVYFNNRGFDESDIKTEESSKEILNNYKGIVDDKMIDKVMKIQTALEQTENDEKIFAYYELTSNINTVISAKEYREAVYNNVSNVVDDGSYEAKEKLLLKKAYEKETIYYMDSYKGVNNLLSNENVFSEYATSFLIILICCNIFVIEHEQNMYKLVISTKKGRRKLYNNKVIISVCVAVICAIVQTLIEILIIGNSYGFSGFSQDIQNLSYYIKSPFDLSVLELIIITFVLRIIGYIIVALITCCISTLMTNSAMPLIITSIIVIGIITLGYSYSLYDQNMFMMVNWELYDKYMILRYFSGLVYLFDTEEFLSRFEVYNILGTPVYSIIVSVISRIIEIIMLYILGATLYKYRFRKSGAAC